MPEQLEELFAHNRAWAAQMEHERPDFFTRLLKQQKPRYMWIGCSDSRVPANQITGLEPGEVFVHRNVANLVIPTDLNCLSTIQYAVDQLYVEHLMIVGHYGCGGVQAALDNARIGLADNWLRHVKDVRDKHQNLIKCIFKKHVNSNHSDLLNNLDHIKNIDFQNQHKSAYLLMQDALCELNVIEQVVNVAQTTVIQDAWARKQNITLHGWCYGLKDGLLHDLCMTVSHQDDLEKQYQMALENVKSYYCSSNESASY